MAQVVGVILGAGLSRRLGRPKQTLPLGDTTLLGRTVREAETSSLDRIVLVTTAEVETRRAELTEPDGRDPSCTATSLRSGLAAAGDADAVMLLLGDMPGVDAAPDRPGASRVGGGAAVGARHRVRGPARSPARLLRRGGRSVAFSARPEAGMAAARVRPGPRRDGPRDAADPPRRRHLGGLRGGPPDARLGLSQNLLQRPLREHPCEMAAKLGAPVACHSAGRFLGGPFGGRTGSAPSEHLLHSRRPQGRAHVR